MNEIEKVVKAQAGCIKTLREVSNDFKETLTSVAVSKFNKWSITVITAEDVKLFILGHIPEWIMSIPTNTEYSVYTLLHNKMQYALNNELRKYKRNKTRVCSDVDFETASIFLHDPSTTVKKKFIVEDLLTHKTLTPIEKIVVKDVIMDGYSYQQIADRENIKIKAAKNAYFRAIKKLKVIYQNEYFSL